MWHLQHSGFVWHTVQSPLFPTIYPLSLASKSIKPNPTVLANCRFLSPTGLAHAHALVAIMLFVLIGEKCQNKWERKFSHVANCSFAVANLVKQAPAWENSYLVTCLRYGPKTVNKQSCSRTKKLFDMWISSALLLSGPMPPWASVETRRQTLYKLYIRIQHIHKHKHYRNQAQLRWVTREATEEVEEGGEWGCVLRGGEVNLSWR